MWVIFFALCFNGGGAVIYHLNDTEYSRMPPLFRLDDYERCLRDPAALYCVAEFQLHAEPGNQLMHIIQEYSSVVERHYDHRYVSRGVCVRDSAAPAAALAARAAAELRPYGVRAALAALHYCHSRTHARAPTDTLDWAVAAGFILLVTSCLLATLYDYRLDKKASKDVGNKYILCFSIIRNWQWLVGFQNEDPKINALTGFHGLRTITNVLTIFAHVLMVIAVGFTHNPHDFEKTYDNIFFIFLYNGVMIIQVFFCMSGFLLVYNLLLRSENTGISWKAVPVVMILRWWRLVPAYAATVAFMATWLRFLGSGPLWNLYVTDTVTADCRKYWWHHMLFINNYVPDDKHCALQTWYLGADTQLFFIGLLIYSTTKHTTRKVVLSLLLVLSVALPALHVWIQDLDGIVLTTPEFFRTLESENFHYMHVFGHNNMSALVVGMVSANLAYNWQKKGVNISRNKIINTLIWLVVPGMAAMLYSAHSFYEIGERAPLLYRILYASLHRLFVSLIVSVLFIGIAMRSETKIVKFLNWRGWVVPSRLSYSVYLLHFNLIYILQGIRKELNTVSYQNLVLCFLGVTIVSYALAVPVFLVIEAPVNRLVKTLLGNVKVKKSVNGKTKGKQNIDEQDEGIDGSNNRRVYSSLESVSRRLRKSD